MDAILARTVMAAKCCDTLRDIETRFQSALLDRSKVYNNQLYDNLEKLLLLASTFMLGHLRKTKTCLKELVVYESLPLFNRTNQSHLQTFTVYAARIRRIRTWY
jgi:hypothetical protein